MSIFSVLLPSCVFFCKILLSSQSLFRLFSFLNSIFDLNICRLPNFLSPWSLFIFLSAPYALSFTVLHSPALSILVIRCPFLPPSTRGSHLPSFVLSLFCILTSSSISHRSIFRDLSPAVLGSVITTRVFNQAPGFAWCKFLFCYCIQAEC